MKTQAQKEAAARYRQKHREEHIVYARKWYQENKERHDASAKKWCEANIEKRRAYMREYQRNLRKDKNYTAKEELTRKKWIAKNPAKRREIMRKARAKWLENNREFERLRQARRRLAKISDNKSANVLCQLISDAPRLKCGICGKNMTKNDRSIDHIIPVAKGGSGEIWNLRIVHLLCNMKKQAKMPDELNFHTS